MKTPILTLGDNGSNNPDDRDCRDYKLDVTGFYEGLPFVGILRPMYTTFEGSGLTSTCSYSDMTAELTDEQSDHIRNAMEFEQYSVFINLSRVSLHRTHVNHQVLMASGTDDHAVCLSVGVVQHSELTGLAHDNGGHHFITIAPVWHDFRRQSAYIATKYRATDLVFPLDSDGIRLSSRSKFEGRPVSDDLRLHAAMLSYNEEVPIYDGRPETEPFTSSAADYSRLETWPRYESEEVPDEAVVIAGYSIAARGGDWPIRTHTSLNILFVIVLVD